MKVLFVSPAFDGEYGGVQASARIAWSGLCTHESISDARQLTYKNGPRGGKIASKLLLLARAARIRSSFDVILVWHLGLVKLLSSLPTHGARITVFLHGIEAWKRLDGLTGRWLANADMLLHNSDHTWRRFVQANPAFAGHQHERLALGIDAPIAQPLPESSVPPAALMLGRLDPRENYKGHQEVIEAWPVVRAALPNAELWIAGDGPLTSKLQNVAQRLNVHSSVRFFGRVLEERKQELISRSRCVALPSRGEGFGLVYLEAMRLGRPCLVSKSDAGCEVVAPPNCGIGVDVGDRVSITAGLIELLQMNVRWNVMSENARRRYEAHFTAAHFQRRLLESLLAGRATREGQVAVA